MTSDLYSLFKKENAECEPKAELLTRIFDNIELEQTKVIRQQKTVWRFAFGLFSIVTIFTGWHAISAITSSDTGSYLSLIFSDTSSALSIWKELSISIIESLPVFGIGLFLASIYLLFWSARKYAIRSHTFAY